MLRQSMDLLAWFKLVRTAAMNAACRHNDRQERKPSAWKLIVRGGLLVMETVEWLELEFGGVHLAI